MKKSNYSIPKVFSSEDLSKSWYVHFRFEGKQFRYKFGINYITNYKKRLTEANDLRDALEQKLREGWNPNVPEIESTRPSFSICEALDFAIEKKTPNISKKTLSGYNGTIKFVKEAIVDLEFSSLPIQETKRIHIKHIIEKAKEQRKWSNNAFNKHLNHFKAILSELIQWDVIENNPAYKINNLVVADSDANIPAAPADVQKIKNELALKHPDFFNFVLTIYHTGIRPEEILKIRLSMVDLNKSQIVLPPEITKTNKKRIVPINKHLLEFYKEMDFGYLPDDFFLFGSFRKPGKGNIGKFKDFIPGPTHINRDTATRRWEKIVKIGLGIEMNMYAMKHLGANDKILAGMSMDALKDLFGHTSKLTTEVYATKIKEVRRNEIMEKSPAF